LAARKSAQLRTNEESLVEMSVLGEVSAPVSRADWRVGPDGLPTLLPGVGGITYNCKVGDSALSWAADHVEPGVSVKTKDPDQNAALNLMACVGNVGRVVGGDAKGAEGVVTGKHGGIDHVLMDFPDEALDALAIGDRIQVRSRGLGLKLLDLPHVALMNMDPRLLDCMGLEVHGDVLRVPVALRVPAAIMGSGLGRSHTSAGDYDIQLFDERVVEQYGLAELRLGDIVAVENADHTFGRTYRTGAVSIGVVVHSRCTTAGHGPGVTTLLSSREGRIEPVIYGSANIAACLRIGRSRPENRPESRPRTRPRKPRK
jgi:Domain of unknown function (DUF4438), N-terminal/Domain of unknown function (DUF4438), C-terminal